jgi:RNA polymerase sigma factor (sigma-70 family)
MKASTRSSVLDGTKHSDDCDSEVAALLAANGGLINKLARSAAWRFPGIDLQDALQTARIATWQAAVQFDPQQGTRFEHFASVCIKNALRKLAAADPHPSLSINAGDEDLPEASDLDGAQPMVGQRSTGESEAHFFGDPGRGAAYQHCLMNEIARYVGCLRPQLREVYFQHVLGGVSQPALAITLGVTQQRVAKLKAELCSHLMELLRDQTS